MITKQAQCRLDGLLMHQHTPAPDNLHDTMRAYGTVPELLSDVMHIERIESPDPALLSREDQTILARGASELVAMVIGRLKGDSAELYIRLDEKLAPLDAFALFRPYEEDDQSKHIVYVASGRAPMPRPLARWLPALLFLVTIFSVLYTGMTIAAGELGLTDPQAAAQIVADPIMNLWRGLPYALAILAILVPHEMGHWLTMRHYRIPASLPYFIPAFGLSPFGTFGAAILLRGTLRNRRVLFDLGASGPLAGLIVAVPILLIGLATSPTVPMQPGGYLEGNSLLYAGAKILTFGRFLPDGQTDVMLNQLAWAGWTGLFVTALNLIPLGQLDGGHVLYALIGKRARQLFWPVLLIMTFLALFVSTAWIAFALMLVLVGRYYAVPLDDVTPLNPARRVLGIVTLVIFVLVFIPNPIYVAGEPSGVLGAFMMVPYMTAFTGMLLALPEMLAHAKLQHTP
ncbi:site-2 protease family protein [Phototrophicus methaneseepsis]|uniref:Site-2 protease family protein n=1 Tax=Phototrophicus methaneseepsis TaxID=2710758 RepID=A0A7S8ECG1_9CHLR|nr:site-2 protease family protein [Phototrophicus methaneseepsis]QPC84423.1 site-2 protease family protein [Phototrophicus methaneseepsis]